MSSLELIPFSQIDPEKASRRFYEFMQYDVTRKQLEDTMPHFLAAYSASPEIALTRFLDIVDATRSCDNFVAYVQMVDNEIVGSATIDGRPQPYKYHPIRGIYLGKVAVTGPSTSSWVAAPYQGMGYGRESLQKRISIVVNDQSEPGLWVKVRNSNTRSANNVVSRGFHETYSGRFWLSGEKLNDASIYQYMAEAG